jgi:hypothetical protein
LIRELHAAKAMVCQLKNIIKEVFLISTIDVIVNDFDRKFSQMVAFGFHTVSIITLDSSGHNYQ